MGFLRGSYYLNLSLQPRSVSEANGIIILNIFPIDFHVKTKNFLFSVTLLQKFAEKFWLPKSFSINHKLLSQYRIYTAVHEGMKQNIAQTHFCISHWFTHAATPLPTVKFLRTGTKHTAVHVAHVNNQHWPTFNMTYLPSNILHFQGNSTVSNIELYFVRSHILQWTKGVPHI